MKVIIRVPNWIGDAVLSLPAIESLKKGFPQAQIWLAGREWAKDLFTPNDFNASVIPLSETNNIKLLKDTSERLKTFGFDAGLLLPNSFSSALLFYLAKIPERWGYSSDGRRLFLTKSVPRQSQENSLHQVHYYLNLLKGLGLPTVSPEIKISVSAEEKEAARQKLAALGCDLKKPLVILNPGAAYGSAKRWPPFKFAEIAALLQEKRNAEPLFIGSSEEMGLTQSIISKMKILPKSLVGKTSLRELLGVISQSALFLSNDSGPVHIANALRTPVVAIFGPTNPRITGPFHQPAVVIQKETACSPCRYRDCPYDHRCMMGISSEEVYDVSRKFLG
ncbi:MAG: lipopolysaccharide heptosyltransferase II [Candidatus Aminicenantales bacterium]